MNNYDKWVTVRCANCGDPFEISGRHYRRNPEHRCRLCRTLNGPVIKPKLEHKRFWLEQWTLDEIREVAQMIWGDENHTL